MHRENRLCQQAGNDHISYAQHKAQQLEQRRLREEAVQQERQQKAETSNQNLASYRALKQQVRGKESRRWMGCVGTGKGVIFE